MCLFVDANVILDLEIKSSLGDNVSYEYELLNREEIIKYYYLSDNTTDEEIMLRYLGVEFIDGLLMVRDKLDVLANRVRYVQEERYGFMNLLKRSLVEEYGNQIQMKLIVYVDDLLSWQRVELLKGRIRSIDFSGSLKLIVHDECGLIDFRSEMRDLEWILKSSSVLGENHLGLKSLKVSGKCLIHNERSGVFYLNDVLCNEFYYHSDGIANVCLDKLTVKDKFIFFLESNGHVELSEVDCRHAEWYVNDFVMSPIDLKKVFCKYLKIDNKSPSIMTLFHSNINEMEIVNENNNLFTVETQVNYYS